MLHLLLLWPTASPYRQEETGQSLSVVLRQTSPHVASRDLREPHATTTDENTISAERTGIQPGVSPSDTPTSTAEIPIRSESRPVGLGAAEREAAQLQAGAAASQGLDAEGVRQYRMALALEARRFKRYPPRALAEDVGGTVEVRIAVAAGGQAQDVALARSSGSEALDDAALEMLRKAAPRTAVPELLRRRSFVVNLPVVFDFASE